MMGVMRILDHTGDRQVSWNVTDPASVRAAEQIFARQVRLRGLAFARPAGGTATEATLMRRFDPAAEELIWVRPIQGG